ncbi:MAG: DNA methyltransferase [Candidatus Bathyarchaeia archaeon]
MIDASKRQSIHGFVFACKNNTEKECIEKLLFGAKKAYGPVVIRIKKGDLLFLNNLNSNSLHGIFKAVSDGGFKIEPEAWKGRYPYQVKVEVLGEKIRIDNAKEILKKLGIKWNTSISGTELAMLIDLFILKHKESPTFLHDNRDKLLDLFLKEKTKIAEDVTDEIPLIEATTLWEFPKQNYGSTRKGDNKYPGVTPALVIYNLIWRYTDPGDLVVDPMCGSGTTIDVCKAEKRNVKGFDILPTRPDITQSDARKLPLEDNSVDLVFVDPPYGDNIKYNNHPDNIGHLSSESEEYYIELEKVMIECRRILKEGKILGWLIGDQWVKGKFTSVGFKVYEQLCKYFEPVDIVCVARRGQSSNTAIWYNRTSRYDFFLRGFKYLFIMRKVSKTTMLPTHHRKIYWNEYKRVR